MSIAGSSYAASASSGGRPLLAPVGGSGASSTTGGISLLDRLQRARNQVAALKERIAGIRRAQEDDIDWASVGRGPDKDNVFSFQIRRLLRGHYGKVHACAWAGDDTTALSASQDSKLILWNGFTEKKKEVVPLKSAWVMACAFDRDDGVLVASGGLDNTCTVHAVGEGHRIVDESDGGRGSGKRAVQKQTKHPVAEFVGHDGYVSDIKFWGGTRILTASGDGTVALWDLTRALHPHAAGGVGHDSAWGLAARLAASGLGSGGGAPPPEPGTGTGSGPGFATSVFSDHTADVMAVSVNPLDPNIFVTGSCDKTVRVWDVRRPRSVRTFEGHSSDVNAVDFFPSGLTVCTGSDDSSCRLFDLRSCGPVHVISDEKLQCGVTDVACSRSGRLLFASYEERSRPVGAPRAAAGGEGGKGGKKVKAALRAAEASAASGNAATAAAAAAGSAAATSSASAAAADEVTGELPCFIVAWEVVSSEGVYHELKGNTKRVSCLSLNTAGQALLSGCWDNDLTIWA